MLSLAALALAPFVGAVRADPITLEKQAIFAVENEGNVLALTCRPGKAEINVDFVPARYYGANSARLGWAAQADSRFGLQTKPQRNAWFFGDRSISYVGEQQNLWREASAKAEFIDALARDREFNIRYEAVEGSVRTVTFSYSINVEDMRQFLSLCGPRKVIARLKAMSSPAAP